MNCVCTQQSYLLRDRMYFESNGMKPPAQYFISRFILVLLASSMLGGCGGYARTPNSNSGVEMYGVIDVGVQHDSR